MFGLFALIVFLVVLSQRGTLGPFTWDPAGARPWQPVQHPAPGRRPATSPESVLAERLANGDITPDDYLQRLGLLQER